MSSAAPSSTGGTSTTDSRWWSMRPEGRRSSSTTRSETSRRRHTEDGRVDLRMPDAVGNLFRTADRSDRTYGPAGQLLEARREDGGVTKYEYDGEGNLVRKFDVGTGANAERPGGGEWRYQWGGTGTLAGVTRPDGGIVRFTYDALGRRTAKESLRSKTRRIYDGNLSLHESTIRPSLDIGNVQPDLTATWVSMPDTFFESLAIFTGENRYATVSNQIGAPVSLYDLNGDLRWAAEFDGRGDLRVARRRPLCMPISMVQPDRG